MNLTMAVDAPIGDFGESAVNTLIECNQVRECHLRGATVSYQGLENARRPGTM